MCPYSTNVKTETQKSHNWESQWKGTSSLPKHLFYHKPVFLVFQDFFCAHRTSFILSPLKVQAMTVILKDYIPYSFCSNYFI